MIPVGATPIEQPNEYDSTTFGNLTTPGRCELSGFDRAYKWDVQMGLGVGGASVVFVAKPPVEGSIKFWAWDRSHFATWNTILPNLKYDPSKAPAKRAIQVYHPFLRDIEASAFVVRKIGGWVHEGGGLYSRVIELLEWIPPVPGIITPAGADPTFQVGQPDPAIVALQNERNEVLAAAQKVYNP